MRKAIIGDLKSKSVPEPVIRETAQKLIASEYLERVCKVYSANIIATYSYVKYFMAVPNSINNVISIFSFLVVDIK